MPTTIEIEITPIDEAVDAILETIKNVYIKDVEEDFISPNIEAKIDKYLLDLKDDLYCVIEYPYVDKVYRDSYYHYYSSKHYSYHRDCIRVSLFESEISINQFLNPAHHKALNGKYLGYFIIRPTLNALFGRSLINPKAFDNNEFKVCTCKTNSLVYGVKLETEGFPHSSQDSETIKCAETTILGLMEYFGNKYPDYRPTLPSKIHRALEGFSYQRQLPSDGLTMHQISFALKDFGFATREYAFEPYDEYIKIIIDSYIESGIPVIVGLDSDKVGHAIIAIGKQYSDYDWKDVKKCSRPMFGKTVEYYDTSYIPAKYVVQDDNMPPYRIISLDKPGEHYEDKASQGYTIDTIVIPLYPKIYLETVIAQHLALQVIKDDKVGYDFGNGFVFRSYLASSRSFKYHISTNQDMSDILKSSIIITKMPKFIWCAEIYTKEAFKSDTKEAIGIVILDATEANEQSIDALIFAGYPDRCISMNENNFVTLQHQFKKYRYYSNLK